MNDNGLMAFDEFRNLWFPMALSWGILLPKIGGVNYY